jgi:threonine dehydrogenase-like Zn-dependent dehydrogenase
VSEFRVPFAIRPVSIRPLSKHAPPLTLGHEFSAVVTAVGEGVDRVAPGDRVSADGCWRCNECAACVAGRHEPESDGREFARAVRAKTGGGAEIVVDCSGAVPALEAGIEMTQRGGRIVIAGIPKKPVPVDASRMVVYERSLIGTLGYANDLPRVARMIASGSLEPGVMITNRIPLGEVADEIERLASDPRDEVKVLAEVGS